MKKTVIKDRLKDYVIITLVSHVLGQAVFLPWNLYIMNFTPDQFIRGALVGLPIAFMWNYAGMKVNLYCSDKVKSIVSGLAHKD